MGIDEYNGISGVVFPKSDSLREAAGHLEGHADLGAGFCVGGKLSAMGLGSKLK